MRLFPLVFFVFLSGCISTMNSDLLVERTTEPEEFIIKNSTVFDGFSFQENQDVWVKDGKIFVLGTKLVAPESITVINGQGKTLLPGLIDVHSHIFSAGAPPWRTTMGDPDTTLSANLAMGITSLLDMAAPLGDISSWENNTEIALPRFAYAGTIFNVEHGHPAYMVDKSVTWPLSKIFKSLMISEVNSLEEAKENIDEHKEEGVSFIKIVFDEIPLHTPTFDQTLLNELVAYAHLQGLKVVAHIGAESNMISCITAKIDLFVHGLYRSNISDETLSLLKESGIPLAPTSVVWDQLVKFYDNSLDFNALEKFVLDPEIKQAYDNRPTNLDIDADIEKWFEVVKQHREIKFEIVDKMYAAQIPLFVGSDSPNIGNVAGASVHRELALWKQHTQMPTEAILSSATGLSGAWLEDYLGWKVGRISVGYEADLLLVDGDLREDINHSQNINSVWIGGQKVISRLPSNQTASKL